MIAYKASAPAGSRWERLNLRLIAQQLRSTPGIWKVVVQAMSDTRPVAQIGKPMWMNDTELADYLESSRRDGWTFGEDHVSEAYEAGLRRERGLHLERNRRRVYSREQLDRRNELRRRKRMAA